MTDFYSRRSSDYVSAYALDCGSERWDTDDPENSAILGISDYFSRIYPFLKKKVSAAFDVGVGPAAREVIRYHRYGWHVGGCDASQDVVDSAKNEIEREGIANSSVVFLHDIAAGPLHLPNKVDLISSLNVVQHFAETKDLGRLAEFCEQNSTPDGYVLLLFKRSDFDRQKAIARGLEIAPDTGSKDRAKYFDKTFSEYREYLVFDTQYVLRVFADCGYRPVKDLGCLSLLRFYNTRQYPCSLLVLGRHRKRC